ncbi:MAG: type V CRISPR-associated endonuclease Cas1 [Ignavibacteria bacterium]|jgi:CRISPR-associated endonuclease Cas1|nr:type V CRISPR-associated endonuclease Cas1 [Ignavibacteria bacterium]
MFTNKDILNRSIVIVNGLDDRAIRVITGELAIVDTNENKTLTKIPFQKILAIFVIGHTTITTPLIDKCTKFGIPLIVMKSNFRIVFFFAITAEANYLLRKKQYEYQKENLLIPKVIVSNKIRNQIRLLEKTRLKNESIEYAKNQCNYFLLSISEIDAYDNLMGVEGRAAKYFFAAYFSELGWKGRRPRTKIDPINATLDIGYTILFNYIEAFVRMFGFDPYRGVYHQLWFKRKSLICDLMEPFRCLIDRQVRKAFNTKQCQLTDFNKVKDEYFLKTEKNKDYSKMFYEVLVEHKSSVFKYIQAYYRAFMQNKPADLYPQFDI